VRKRRHQKGNLGEKGKREPERESCGARGANANFLNNQAKGGGKPFQTKKAIKIRKGRGTTSGEMNIKEGKEAERGLGAQYRCEKSITPPGEKRKKGEKHT